MPTLQTTENWEYGVTDVVKGLFASLGQIKHDKRIKIPGIGDCIPTRSGRAGIYAALKALGLLAGARVAVPLYCCPVVFKAVRAAGFSLRFIDVDPTTFCMSPEALRAKSSQVDAVIAVHMFGNMCDMPGLKAAAQGKPIIEDCAQALGSRYEGRMAGSFGTASVFSFRLGKYLSVGEGGAVFSSDPQIQDRLGQCIVDMPAPTLREECMHVMETYIRSLLRSTPFYGIYGHHIWRIYNKRVDFLSQSPFSLSQIYISDLIHAVARMERLDTAIKKQRANAEHYLQTLSVNPKMLCQEKSPAFYNRFMFPILFSCPEMRDRMADYLYRRQIDTSQPYKMIAHIAAAHYGYAGDCPMAEQVAQRVMVIPSHHRLKPRIIKYISECLNDGIKWIEA